MKRIDAVAKTSGMTTNNKDLLREWDNNHVWHPFTPMLAWQSENAPIISDADGFDLIDTAGNRYLDGISSLWCNIHGHRVPEIDSAIRDQLDRVAHTTLLGLSSPPAIELAKALVDRAPAGLTRVFYSDSGSTAVEAALKQAYQFHVQKKNPEPERTLFVGVNSAYHGDTIGSVSVGGMPLFHRTYRNMLFEKLLVPTPGIMRPPKIDGSRMTKSDWIAHCFAEAERIIEEYHDRIAAFVIEPLVQGAAGILVHPTGFLKHIRDLTARHGIPLIADEVAVGFGRTGTMFACEQEDVKPDFLCVAKGLTAGYLPVAATLTTEEIYAAFLDEPAAGKTFFHGHTFTGNALGCAAGLASLELFDTNNILANVADVSATLRERLNELADHPHVGEIRQCGIMVGIELVADRTTCEPFDSTFRIGHQVTLAARKRGVILRPLGDVVVLMPAPAMPVQQIHQLCDVAIESIRDVVGK